MLSYSLVNHQTCEDLYFPHLSVFSLIPNRILSCNSYNTCDHIPRSCTRKQDTWDISSYLPTRETFSYFPSLQVCSDDYHSLRLHRTFHKLGYCIRCTYHLQII